MHQRSTSANKKNSSSHHRTHPFPVENPVGFLCITLLVLLQRTNVCSKARPLWSPSRRRRNFNRNALQLRSQTSRLQVILGTSKQTCTRSGCRMAMVRPYLMEAREALRFITIQGLVLQRAQGSLTMSLELKQLRSLTRLISLTCRGSCHVTVLIHHSRATRSTLAEKR